MTDRQKLVYDLAMQCLSADLKKNGIPSSENPAVYVLDSFSGYIDLYTSMLPDKLDAVLFELKKA